MMKRQPYALVVVLVVVTLLALSACGGKPAEQEPTAAPAAAEETKAQEEAKATPTPKESAPEPTEASEEAAPEPTEVPPTATPQEVEEELSLSAITEGLADLNSYRITMHMTIEGKDEDGEPFSAMWDMLEEATQDPAAQRVTVSSAGSQAGETGAVGSFEMITVGDMTYMVTEDDQGRENCVSFSSDEEDLAAQTFLRPDTLGDIDGAKYRGTEVVNGIRSKRYEWAEDAASIFGFADSRGQVWVAVDGGYTVKYTAEASGKGTFLADTLQEAKMTIEYDLVEVDSGLVIAVPDGCEATATDIPVMADAQERASFGDMLTYSTPSAMDDVVAFYEKAMIDNGWQEGDAGMKMEGMAMLNYTKDGRAAQVMISFDEDTQLTSVMVSSGEE